MDFSVIFFFENRAIRSLDRIYGEFIQLKEDLLNPYREQVTPGTSIPQDLTKE